MARMVIPALVVAVGLVGCAPGEAPEPAATPTPLAAPALELEIVELPPAFRMVSAGGDAIHLEPTDRPGSVTVTVEETDTAGVNLVAAVKSHQTEIEQRDGGDYQGTQELAGPLGTAFISRGRFAGEAGEEEEIAIFTLHPTRDAMVVIRSIHPSGSDASARAQALLDLLVQIGAPGQGTTTGADEPGP